VFDRDAVSAPRRSWLDGSLRLEIDSGIMLAAATLCASTEGDAQSRAAVNTIENDALHMNFPLLEQAQVCLPGLQSAIVRMAHELFLKCKYTGFKKKS